MEDDHPEAWNFHSAFYFEEEGQPYVGLLRTGAVVENIAPHVTPREHEVVPSPVSEVWTVPLDRHSTRLRAELLPGIRELSGIAISHLDVDAVGGDGFVLFANCKQADVAEETHGENLYGERAESISELYSGMIVEAFNFGLVMRYERHKGVTSIKTFRRPFDPARTSLGHSWLPINVQLDPSRTQLFCSFSGLRPRLLQRHIAAAYPGWVVDPQTVRYIPPLLMRFNASTLEPDYDDARSYLSYAEPMPLSVLGEGCDSYASTFSPETGLRIYRANDLNTMVAHAVSADLLHWRDSHFRPEPAHMAFVPRRK
jgi:hypothetical protein